MTKRAAYAVVSEPISLAAGSWQHVMSQVACRQLASRGAWAVAGAADGCISGCPLLLLLWLLLTCVTCCPTPGLPACLPACLQVDREFAAARRQAEAAAGGGRHSIIDQIQVRVGCAGA